MRHSYSGQYTSFPNWKRQFDSDVALHHFKLKETTIMSKPNIKLNTEQRKLVEDNHDLIYGFMVKYKLDFNT